MTEEDEAFIRAFVGTGNHGAKQGDFAVGWDPANGMEVLVWKGLPVASRKLLFINGVSKRIVGIWKAHKEIPAEIEDYLKSLHDESKNILVA